MPKSVSWDCLLDEPALELNPDRRLGLGGVMLVCVRLCRRITLEMRHPRCPEELSGCR